MFSVPVTGLINLKQAVVTSKAWNRTLSLKEQLIDVDFIISLKIL